MNAQIQDLIKNLKQLPGVGEKTAQRLAFFLIHSDHSIASNLAESMKRTIEKICHCKTCNILTTNETCEICSDDSREQNKICIVENTQDVYLIEKTNIFKGRYLVLGNLLSPIDGIGPNQLPFDKINDYLENSQIDEIILALNPSTEGESTIHYISDLLTKYDLKVTRLATGLPFGGDIEYTSPMTLSNALQRRFIIE